MAELPIFEMERMFDAPPALVWRTWTEADLIGRWYGPGVETHVHELDVRVGGLWRHEMKMGPKSMYQRMEYTVVEPPSRLVMLMSTADENWEVAANPMMPNWPTVLLTTVTFEAVGAQTKMVLTWAPHGASAAEVEAFRGAMAGLGNGWGAGMEILAQVLAELQS